MFFFLSLQSFFVHYLYTILKFGDWSEVLKISSHQRYDMDLIYALNHTVTNTYFYLSGYRCGLPR
jgi:hypothetical protein